MSVVAYAAGDKLGEGAGVEFAAWGEVSVAADFAFEVEFGFAVLSKSVRRHHWDMSDEMYCTRESQMERGLMCRFMR